MKNGKKTEKLYSRIGTVRMGVTFSYPRRALSHQHIEQDHEKVQDASCQHKEVKD